MIPFSRPRPARDPRRVRRRAMVSAMLPSWHCVRKDAVAVERVSGTTSSTAVVRLRSSIRDLILHEVLATRLMRSISFRSGL